MLLLPVAMSQTVQGAESTDACPKRLGMAANNEMTQQTAKFCLIYAKLGCRVTLVKLPSRRSYVAFNKGNIDGEIFRTLWRQATTPEPIFDPNILCSRYPKVFG